jgi:acyl-CoA thioester hydrolase
LRPTACAPNAAESFELMAAIEVWRGGVNPWECDEMGHLNVRFYARIAGEGLAGFAPHLAVGGAFREGASATLLIQEQHIRFLREARNRAALYMTATLVEMDETSARILLLIIHADNDQPCASFLTRVSHVTTADGRPFPWPKAARQAAIGLMGETPEFARPRSISAAPVTTTASLDRANALGLIPIGAGAFTRRDLDLFGRMESELVIGRVSDGVTHLVNPFRETVTAHTETKPKRVGGAVLEYRLVHFDWPRAGDRFAIRSGVAGVDGRGQRIVHWMLDPASGRPWAASEAYVVTFDLDARKIIPVTAEAQAIIQSRIAPGLAL